MNNPITASNQWSKECARSDAEISKENSVNSIMEQAQVFASAWSLVGGRFDNGDAMETAVQEKECLRQMVITATASKQQECTRSHPHENMSAMCELRTQIAQLDNEASHNADLNNRQALRIAELERKLEFAEDVIAGNDVLISEAREEGRKEAVPEWMPIETAPKDGSWIIATSTHNKYFRVAVQFQYGQWLDVNETNQDCLMLDAATHWMPLPAAPSPASLKEGGE